MKWEIKWNYYKSNVQFVTFFLFGRCLQAVLGKNKSTPDPGHLCVCVELQAQVISLTSSGAALIFCI